MEIFTSSSKYFLDSDDIAGEKCRTCFKKTTNIWQLFESDAEISTRIMACAAVQIQQGDGLPNVICYSCRELLDVSYNFKCQVEKSDAKFREALKMQPPLGFHNDTVPQSVNAVISEGISDEISSRQMEDNTSQADENLEQYQTQVYFTESTNDEDDDVTDDDDDDDDDDDEEEEEEDDDNDNDNDDDDNNKDVEERNVLAFEGNSAEGHLDEKISLNTAPYVESNEIFIQKQLKKEQVEGNEGKEVQVMAESSLMPSEIDVKEGIISCETQTEKYLHQDKDLSNESPVMQIHEEVSEDKTQYRYVCYMCEKQFVTIEKLKTHVANIHSNLENPEKDSADVNCLEETASCEQNDNSGTMRKKKSKFFCKYCPKQFTYEKSFLTHAKRHPEYKKLEKKTIEREEECNERRVDNDSEDEDMPLEGLQCTQCGKLFATKRNLKRHISTHSGLKFNCPTCQRGFSRADKLKEHEQSKHRNQFFSLSDENNDTDTENENKRDSNNSDSRNKEKNHKPHQCPMCPKSFAHSQTLTNHVERHKKIKQPQKRFLCEVCSKCFAQSGSLVAHMRTHTGVKPYVCNVCSRAFTKSTYLQLHLRTHSGEKPYICQYCSRAFARANTLARHITMHTGEAKYHCQICMKSFRRLTSLNEHTYTHTGQRPYACKICTKRYNNAGSLYAHTKKCKAQQISSSSSSSSSNNSVINNYTVSLDNSNANDPNCQSSPMLIPYTPKKCDPQTPVNPETAMPEFILPNVQPEKSLSPNLIQPVSADDANLYSVNTKQFKNFYYTTYPSL